RWRHRSSRSTARMTTARTSTITMTRRRGIRGGRPSAPAGRGEAAFSPAEAAALYRLMAWLSPAYPVGAFSYSSGLEWAVETGDIRDADALRGWIATLLDSGGGFCDAVFLAAAHRAAAEADDVALIFVAELAQAFAPSRERHLETTAQGSAFVEATRRAWPC